MASLVNSTLIQDNDIPIFITLQYGINVLKFPINPDNLTKEISSESETVDIEGIGQIGIPTTPKLARISINSLFWKQINYVPPAMYVAWLEKWQKSKKPALLIVTRFNYSMQVTCESFKHWINAGEEDDVYFELQLQEYRPYGAKKLNVIKNQNLLNGLKVAKDILTSPILIEIPRPTRSNTNKSEINNPYTVLENETISTITKKITGQTDEWELLYEQNSDKLGDIYAEKSEIPAGTLLTLPNKWVDNTSYNIKTLSIEMGV